MSKWKDETSYSRGAKRRDPNVLALGLPHGVQQPYRLLALWLRRQLRLIL